jgi:hypothetical protein
MIMRRVLDLVFRGFDLIEKVRTTIRPRHLAEAAVAEVRHSASSVQEVVSDRVEQAIDRAEDAMEHAVGAAATRTVAAVHQVESSLKSYLSDVKPSKPRAKKKATKMTATPAKAPVKKAKKKVVAKKTKATRKGSVDRVGKDVDSPRARAIGVWLREQGAAKLNDDAALDGKKLPARVAWALLAAERAGSEQGLTASDVSALLSSTAKMEVFATNIGRSLREESAWFTETAPDGRSKRYRLTAAGKKRAATLGG